MDEKFISEETIATFARENKIVQIRDYSKLKRIKPLDFSSITQTIPLHGVDILHPIVPEQGIVFIYAATGVGKTLFTLNLAYAIAQGGNYLKYAAPKPRKVLYIDGEMSYSDIYHRLMAIQDQQGKLNYPENFKLYTPDMLRENPEDLPERLPKICTTDGQNFYNEVIKEHDIEVIVFDNLSMLSTIDENKSQEWCIVQDWLNYLRSINRTSIMVHHSGKDKNGYRGTSRMLDAADTAISLQGIEPSAEDEIDIKKFKVQYHKHRKFNGASTLPFEVQLHKNVWSYRSNEQSLTDRVIECVKAKVSQRDIAKELGCSQATVHRLIKNAKRIGLLRD